MFYVYLLRSQSSPEQVYTGFTEDLRQRLAEHNMGKSTHTKVSHLTLKKICAANS